MDIDVYQHCPCHSGKKIKFCCGKDVVNELNEIVAKNKGGQPLAALGQLERVIEKHGPLNCLLTIQTHILISQGEIEKATESNNRFLEANPDAPIGHQHKALIAVAEGNSADAVTFLQDTMDAITGNQIPLSVAHAFRMVGILLFSEGSVLAGRAHLHYASLLKGPEDLELQEIIFETIRAPEVSILLKRNFELGSAPNDKEWGPKYANVIRAQDRGQFRKGLQLLHRIDQQFPDEPMVVKAIATLESELANVEAMAAAWRRYSRLDSISMWDAVEAEALAQLFDIQPITEIFEIVRTSFEVKDFEKVSEIALSSARMTAFRPLESDPFEEGPAPRACYSFLDREKINDVEQLALDNIASIVGEVLVYGKQTDRTARMEWISTRNADFERYKSDLKMIFGDEIIDDGTELNLGHVTAVGDALSWNWQLPEGISRELHADLIQQNRRRALFEDWAEIEFTILKGKTPREAAKDPDCLIPLSALILHLEQSPDSQVADQSIATELRDELGVPKLPTIDPNELENSILPPLRQQFLEFDKLSDDRLLKLHTESIAIGNVAVLRKLVPELLNRRHLDQQFPRDISLSMMAQLAEHDDKAFEFLQEAKAFAKESGRPIGVYLVQEFEMRMVRGMTDKLQGLFQRIQAHHMREPNVEYQLTRVLARFGLLDRQPSEAAEMEPDVPEKSGVIWTPQEATSAPTGAETPSASKLWLPGSD